jgi:hypothetical protein
MRRKQNLVVVPTALFILVSGMAHAEQTINESGAMALVIDKWNESEPSKGHKIADYAGRCVTIPDAPGTEAACDCIGKYEFMQDGSWKGAGTCTVTYKGGDTMQETWEEGSHLKEYLYKITSGTGKYAGAIGEGTYTSENLTDTLQWGRYKGTIQLP